MPDRKDKGSGTEQDQQGRPEQGKQTQRGDTEHGSIDRQSEQLGKGAKGGERGKTSEPGRSGQTGGETKQARPRNTVGTELESDEEFGEGLEDDRENR
jgi:hypothetical protein